MRSQTQLQPAKPVTSLNPRPAAVVREVNDPEERILRFEVVRVAA